MTYPNTWHSHIYFDTANHLQADLLVKTMQKFFRSEPNISYGRWHHEPVGPHPDHSIQIEFPHELFTEVMTFLCLNRKDLTIFSHPNTGDSLLDHRDHAIWMGAVRPLKLSLFRDMDQTQDVLIS